VKCAQRVCSLGGTRTLAVCSFAKKNVVSVRLVESYCQVGWVGQQQIALFVLAACLVIVVPVTRVQSRYVDRLSHEAMSRLWLGIGQPVLCFFANFVLGSRRLRVGLVTLTVCFAGFCNLVCTCVVPGFIRSALCFVCYHSLNLL
jgi:hypothetical protein